jgi:excinuclease ABC subunit C
MKDMPFDTSSISFFPSSPGAYIMKDAKGTVLYVGKAKNLRKRIKQYFTTTHETRPHIIPMISSIKDIETIVVATEKEAFLLEDRLIKKYKPKYNVIFKDDKSYACLAVNTAHEWPVIRLIRYKEAHKHGGELFGPYPSIYTARKTLDLLNTVFPLRQCSDNELSSRSRPCLLHDIGKCTAPCVHLCTKKEYGTHVKNALAFLSGNSKDVIRELRAEMNKSARMLEFEHADAVLKKIHLLEKATEAQNICSLRSHDALDIISFYRQGPEIMISQLFVRDGNVVGAKNHHYSDIMQLDNDIMHSFLIQAYKGSKDLPKEVLVPAFVCDPHILEDALAVKTHTPRRGYKVKLLEMTHSNAKAALNQCNARKAVNEKALIEMQELFHIPDYPLRIECFDVSHTAANETVAAMTVFINGEKKKSLYRRYIVKKSSGDDYSALRETLLRRYRATKKNDDIPDLIIIDGGKAHLDTAMKALSATASPKTAIIAIAKEKGRHDKGLSQEQIFLPKKREPMLLPLHSPTLFMLQNIRDETHRYVISYHRKRRAKASLHSKLKNIPGIGPVKQKRLLQHFGSVQKIKNASEKDLRNVKGINSANVNVLRRTLQ